MEPSVKHRTAPTKLIMGVVVLVLAAGVLGWRLGHTTKSASSTGTPATSVTSGADTATAAGDVKALVSYTLPDGWQEATCPSAVGKVYIVPNASKLDCNANPSAPIKLYVDAQNSTDCQQLANVQNVRKHVCISLYISGHKSLKSSTEYPKSSTYSADTTVSDYFINTGKGIVAVEYTYASSNDYQTGFDQFATAISVKK